MLTVLYMISLIIKYFILFLNVLNSNENIHEQMINGIVRSPATYFDVTPSGVLVNKFSNDLGILDNSLGNALIEMLKGIVYVIIAMVNICQFYVFFIPPVVVIFVIAYLFYWYSKAVLLQCKQIDLTNKNSIFQSFSETISGLVQIRTYNRRKSLINQFSHVMNKSTKAAISFDLVTRAFGFYQTFIGLVLMFIGINIGVSQSNSSNNGLFGVTVIFLVNFSDTFQWCMKRTINTESFMISYERVSEVINMTSEK